MRHSPTIIRTPPGPRRQQRSAATRIRLIRAAISGVCDTGETSDSWLDACGPTGPPRHSNTRRGTPRSARTHNWTPCPLPGGVFMRADRNGLNASHRAAMGWTSSAAGQANSRMICGVRAGGTARRCCRKYVVRCRRRMAAGAVSAWVGAGHAATAAFLIVSHRDAAGVPRLAADPGRSRGVVEGVV